jgi:hypothetical protein
MLRLCSSFRHNTQYAGFKTKVINCLLFSSFGVLRLMLPEACQPYGLLYYPRIGLSNFLHQSRAATPPEQRKLEL